MRRHLWEQSRKCPCSTGMAGNFAAIRERVLAQPPVALSGFWRRRPSARKQSPASTPGLAPHPPDLLNATQQRAYHRGVRAKKGREEKRDGEEIWRGIRGWTLPVDAPALRPVDEASAPKIPGRGAAGRTGAGRHPAVDRGGA